MKNPGEEFPENSHLITGQYGYNSRMPLPNGYEWIHNNMHGAELLVESAKLNNYSKYTHKKIYYLRTAD
jgi:hypothetical protein